MKVKLTKDEIERIAQDPESKVKIQDPWWVVVLKVIAYITGLLLAGYGTAQAAIIMAT